MREREERSVRRFYVDREKEGKNERSVPSDAPPMRKRTPCFRVDDLTSIGHVGSVIAT